MNIQHPAMQAPVLFSGTGQNGKPRVVIGKAAYTMYQYDQFKKNDQVEIVGIAHNAKDFEKLLNQHQPDVAIIGGTFGVNTFALKMDEQPMSVLLRYIKGLKDKVTPQALPGVVIHSLFTQKDVQDCASSDPTALQNLKIEYYPDSKADNILASILKVDPHPVTAAQSE